MGSKGCRKHVSWPHTCLSQKPGNEGQSPASFYRQVAAWFSDMFCNFYLVKICKIAKNSTGTKPREKISTDLEPLESLKKFDEWLTKF